MCICVLKCILCLCYALRPMHSAPVVVLFYLRFLYWMSLFVLFVFIFCNFCSLSSVADFSNTEARAPTSAGRVPFLLARSAMQFGHVVWVWVMFFFRGLFLFSSIEAKLRDEQQYFPDRTNYPDRSTRDLYAHDQVRHCVRPSGNLSAGIYVHYPASHGVRKKHLSFLLFR